MADFNLIKLIPATFEDMRLLYDITQISMAPMSQNINKQKYTEQQKELHYKKYIIEFTPELSNTFLISCDYKIVGRLRVTKNLDSVHLGGIQLLPDYTGQGIGGFILDQLISEARQDNQNITLLVHKVNHKAIKFYKSRGFEIQKETEKQFEMILRFFHK